MFLYLAPKPKFMPKR